MFRIGSFEIKTPLILAPMAGVTDLPFRQLCLRLGAGMAVSEMVSANPALRGSRKSEQRLDHSDESEPRAVQIAGTNPGQLADFARFNVDNGAQIIDINMGCPAKKVCAVSAGSALLKDASLVGEILDAVVAAVDVPVTLKFRTGWDRDSRNAVQIARIAEAAGVQMLALHGRSRADRFAGDAEYETIRAVRESVSIPLAANGDIDSPEKAISVLQQTGAEALMIGRAAQGNPWIFSEIAAVLRGDSAQSAGYVEASVEERREVLLEHVRAVHAHYGRRADGVMPGVRIARKHVRWYTRELAGGESFWSTFNRVDDAEVQLALIDGFFTALRGKL